MFYHVKLIFSDSLYGVEHAFYETNNILEDDFDCVSINEASETLFLYTRFVSESDERQIERLSIPLCYIKSIEVIPIYEDNR